MRVSVILIAYNGDRWIPDCVASLAGASQDRLHLVLLDNAHNTRLDAPDYSAFDTEILAAPHPMGFAEANNFALVNASRLEEIVLFLNQDTISPAGWIDACLACFDAHSGLGAVSPVIRDYADENWDPSFLACLPGKQLPPPDGKPCFANEKAPAPALLVRRDVLARCGPFDPVYGSYYEDYDLCLRIRRQGHGIAFSREGRILHFSGSTTDTPAKERRRMRHIIRNRTIYELRKSRSARPGFMMKRFLTDLPRRMARGLAGTPSSQPPGVVLGAYGDLLALLPRLLSAQKDEAAWQDYLRELGWDDVVHQNPATPKGVRQDLA